MQKAFQRQDFLRAWQSGPRLKGLRRLFRAFLCTLASSGCARSNPFIVPAEPQPGCAIKPLRSESWERVRECGWASGESAFLAHPGEQGIARRKKLLGLCVHIA